jgi:predicted SAM-dependent methyltransferase
VGGLYTKNAKRFPSHVRFGDIVKGLPVPDASCAGIYASHVLEHLPLQDFHRAVENSKRILKPGGIFRVVVPDLECQAKEYLNGAQSGDPMANDRFLRGSFLGCETRPRNIKEMIYDFLRTSSHFWMWDYPSLIHALKEHGFAAVRPCTFGDSPDPMFSLVENAGRFKNAVAVEAMRNP